MAERSYQRFSIMVAQHFGARKYARMRHNVAMSIYLCLAFVLVMTIALEILNYPILRLMNAPDGIIHDTAGYMAVIYAGLFATAAYNGLAAVMRALGDSRSPLYFLIISAIINVFLDVAFIIWFGMGVEGCAYATVIAQAVSALLCFLYIVKKFDILKLGREDFCISFGTMGRLLSIGIPMGLQFSITAIGTIIVQGAVNVFGSVYIAGFSAAGKIQNIVSTVFVAFGATAATYVGQNRGAGRMDRGDDSGHPLLWGYADSYFHRFLGDSGNGCCQNVFQGSGMVLPLPGKHLPVQECPAGPGIRTHAHDGRRVRAAGQGSHSGGCGRKLRLYGRVPGRPGSLAGSPDSHCALLLLQNLQDFPERNTR